MRLSTWVQFAWNLATLPKPGPKLDARYVVESASVEERPALSAAFTRSLSMEPMWNDDLKPRLKLVEEVLGEPFSTGEVAFLAIKHGARIIAATAIRDAGDKVSNLPLGVCVLNEYRCRGLGSYLLYEGLCRLHDRGLNEARLITKKGLPADRFLYYKFGSVRTELVGLPA
jgi:GNAT superfamily N-acetyltransferase